MPYANEHPDTYQSSTTSPTVELSRGLIDYYEPVDAVPVRMDSINNGVMLQSQADYHNPDLPRYVLHQTVHNNVWEGTFNWEVEQAFEVERFDAQFGDRYLAGVQNLPSYNESRLIYGR